MISNKAKELSSKGHIDKSIQVGVNGENEFKRLLLKHNIPFTSSTDDENMKSHIDYFIWGKPVDVKGLKKSHLDGFIVVEFKNVQGRHGWCSKDSPIEYVAFQFKNGFVILKKDEILEYCRNNVSNEYVNDFKDAYKKMYTRSGRKDLMTKLHLDDIDKMEFAVILK